MNEHTYICIFDNIPMEYTASDANSAAAKCAAEFGTRMLEITTYQLR